MLTIQGIPKNPQPLQSNHCARSRMVPPDARRLSPNPLVERSKQLQAKRYVATTISMCACVLTSVSVFVIHMSYVYYVYLCITVDKGQSLAQYSNGLLQSLHLKEKGRVHDPVRIHRLDRNGNQKPFIDWLSNTSPKKWLYLSLSTRRRF